jgi:hypothetical protein
MSASVLFMSMSLDGYIAGPNDEVGNPGGDGFDRLHEWYGDFSRPSGAVGELWDEWNTPGAILAGRRTVEQIDHWGGDNHGVSIFVPSHRPPGPSVANYARRVHGTTGAGGRCAGRAADPSDPSAVRWWPPSVRGVAFADRAGDRSGDRHTGCHAHPLSRSSLSGVLPNNPFKPKPLRGSAQFRR